MDLPQRPSPPGLNNLLAARQGHFLLESGHHTDLWLDLELLFLWPRRVEPFIGDLAARVSTSNIEVVCGPLNEGAFVALQIAALLNLPFTYAARFVDATSTMLYPVSYRLPPPQRAAVAGKRVTIVNDVISAGSAVRGALADLRACGAHPIAIASLLTLGDTFPQFAATAGVPLITLAHLPFTIWTPADCPLCVAEIPLEDPLTM